MRKSVLLSLFLFTVVQGEAAPKLFSICGGGIYSYWTPDSINNVDYNTTGAGGGFIELDSPLYNTFTLKPILRYEWTPGSKSQNELIEKLEADRDSFEKIYKYILVHLPLGRLNISYDKEVFIAALTMQEDKTYHPFSGNSTYYRRGETITESVIFERASIHYKPEMYDYLYFGASIGKYQKPYSIEDNLSSRYQGIYDSEFSYFSLDFGIYGDYYWSTGWFVLYEAGVSLAGGDIKFSNNHSVNEDVLEDRYFINSFHTNGRLGIGYTMGRVDCSLDIELRNIQYDLNKSLDYSNEYVSRYEKTKSINNDFIAKVKLGAKIRF